MAATVLNEAQLELLRMVSVFNTPVRIKHRRLSKRSHVEILIIVEPFKTADAYGLRENCPRFLLACIFKLITIIT